MSVFPLSLDLYARVRVAVHAPVLLSSCHKPTRRLVPYESPQVSMSHLLNNHYELSKGSRTVWNAAQLVSFLPSLAHAHAHAHAHLCCWALDACSVLSASLLCRLYCCSIAFALDGSSVPPGNVQHWSLYVPTVALKCAAVSALSARRFVSVARERADLWTVLRRSCFHVVFAIDKGCRQQKQ